MKPKPLTKEEREWIEEHPLNSDRPIEMLLAAEAYWRLAVKNATFTHVTNDGWRCHFCDETSHQWDQHKTDCPWKLAQE